MPPVTNANRYLYLTFGSGYELKMIDLLVNTLNPQIQNNNSNKYFVYSTERNIVVESTENNSATINIYNICGQSVFSGNFNGLRKSIPINGNGMYLVQIKSNNDEYIFKKILL